MRLMIIGSLHGELSTASKMAIDRGANVTHAPTIDTALKDLRAGQGADLLMIDVSYDISTLVENLKSEHFHIPVIACGTEHDANAAVEAIRAGAKEYIPLPPDAEMIAAVLEAVSAERNAFIYRDEKMQEVMKLADQIAKSDASILITGESGTGKEVMARYLHEKSSRSGQQFISLN